MGSARSQRRQHAQPGHGANSASGNHSPLKFSIPSSFDHGRDVQTQIIDAVESHKFNPDAVFAIKLALEEALINAIKHGNKLDPKKQVKIEASVDSKVAKIVIEDEGPGFKRDDVPDPTADENICKCSGRGILLIEAYMSSANWTKGGRRLEMTRRNEPNPTE